MFFKSFLKDGTLPKSRPAVKKVSEFINNKSHKQKKYISLMLVPSYSGGKTRSLRIPRGVFHGVLACMLVISAVVAGFYLRSNYHMRAAHDSRVERDELAENFAEFQNEAENIQSDLIDAVIQVYERYSEVQQSTQNRIDSQRVEHQSALEILWEQFEEFEEMLRELEEAQRAAIEGLRHRAEIIPPIADILNQMEESREAIVAAAPLPATPLAQPVAASVGFMSFGGQPQLTEEELQARIDGLMHEINLQGLLLSNLSSYRQRMDGYLRNYPTLWPVAREISSGFGWRRNPMGGGGSEHHNGVDIPAPRGTAIMAAGGGTVTFVGWRNGYGNTIVINHGGGITTKYAHNSYNRVAVGQVVERGHIIGDVGTTGRTTGPHVHFEVLINDVPVDPIAFMHER
ncbi:MAG: peptidoglycan DD-metalloendopeptidase family protein [Defluviitaleaceae bacterium]|nr:peptidoglycan DD-metalloendopeptidase family protein [Defluviitaleaceae bacterium]